jgi:stage V sporulation protein SpoVS
MRLHRALATLGAAAAVATAACDVPFAPKWDADMYLPLTTQPIHLASFVPGPPLNVIPGNGALTVSFPPQQQDVTGPIRDVLKNAETDPAKCQATGNAALTCHVLALTITKTTAIAAQDTLFVAPDSAGLFTPRTGGIAFPVPVLATDLTRTDSINLSPAQITMLQNAANASQNVWVQLRGRVTNPSASAITITVADSIAIKVSATIRIRVSHR